MAMAISRLERSHGPEIAFRVAHIKLRTPLGKGWSACHVQGAYDIRSSHADALVVLASRLGIRRHQRDAGVGAGGRAAAGVRVWVGHVSLSRLVGSR